MKKVLTIAIVIALGFGAYAQDESITYKPTSGDITVDLGLSGGLASTSVSYLNQGFGVGQTFKARYFTGDQQALRATLRIVSNSESQNLDKNGNSSSKGNTSIVLGGGLEKHFTGTDRLSPYIGGDLIINITSSSESNDLTKTELSRTDFGLGVKGVFGADYYFVKNVYLGVEAGLGISYTAIGKTTTTTSGTKNTAGGGSKFSVAPGVVSGIRIGYVF